jgi:hypothetical protein
MTPFASLNGKQPPKTSLRAVRSVASASLQNEQVTRQRVDKLEAWAGHVARIVSPMLDRDAYLNSGLWARLRWLVLGDRALPVQRNEPEEDAPRADD